MTVAYTRRQPKEIRFVQGLGVLAAACLTLQAAAQPPTSGESTHFELDAPFGSSSADRRALGTQLDEIFEVIVERVGVSLDQKVTVRFAPPNPSPCRPRGATVLPRPGSNGMPVMIIFADENTDSKQISAGVAHELGHVLEVVALNAESIASVFLEGFATWAAGPYWLEWQGAASFRSAVASYIATETYLPLHENDGVLDTLSDEAASRLGEDCLSHRDIVYTEWGAFVEYLVEEHGRDRLHALFRAPPLVSDDRARPLRRPNFPAIYGMPLERLEAAWLETIHEPDRQLELE